jgi:hypothetical protein
MPRNNRKQLTFLGSALVVYAALVFITYLATPFDQLAATGLLRSCSYPGSTARVPDGRHG